MTHTLPESPVPAQPLVNFDYHRLLDTLGDPVVVADGDSAIVYMNAAAEHLLGWQRNELLHRPLATIQPERFRDAHLEGFRRYLRTRVPTIIGRPVRVSALHRDGTEIDIELSLSVVDGADGEVLIVASLRDLRARVELERQMTVMRYLRATTATASRLPTLLDLDRVLTAIVETLVTDFDAALARVWLYEAESEMLHLRASAGVSTETTHSSRAHMDVRSHQSKVAEVARSRKPFIQIGLSGDARFEQDFVLNEGIAAVAAFPLLLGSTLRGVLVLFARRPLPDEVVEVLHSFAAIATTAINDVHLLASERAARGEAEDAVRVRDEFLSTVSHDLKNPLAAIKGRAQILGRRARRLPEVEAGRFIDGLEHIDGLTTRMTHLINDLVDVTRLQIGQPLDLNQDTVDIVELVRQVAGEQEPTSGRHRIAVTSTADSIVGTWDRSRLERVLVNLLNNAVKYTPEGGDISVTIDCQATPLGNTAVIQIQDPGIGIPSADVPHVFQRYHRASNVVDKIEGTGVGLAGAKQIIEQHGGTIDVDSCEGKGTTFIVRLPVKPSPRQ